MGRCGLLGGGRAARDLPCPQLEDRVAQADPVPVAERCARPAHAANRSQHAGRSPAASHGRPVRGADVLGPPARAAGTVAGTDPEMVTRGGGVRQPEGSGVVGPGGPASSVDTARGARVPTDDHRPVPPGDGHPSGVRSRDHREVPGRGRGQPDDVGSVRTRAHPAPGQPRRRAGDVLVDEPDTVHTERDGAELVDPGEARQERTALAEGHPLGHLEVADRAQGEPHPNTLAGPGSRVRGNLVPWGGVRDPHPGPAPLNRAMTSFDGQRLHR